MAFNIFILNELGVHSELPYKTLGRVIQFAHPDTALFCYQKSQFYYGGINNNSLLILSALKDSFKPTQELTAYIKEIGSPPMTQVSQPYDVDSQAYDVSSQPYDSSSQVFDTDSQLTQDGALRDSQNDSFRLPKRRRLVSRSSTLSSQYSSQQSIITDSGGRKIFQGIGFHITGQRSDSLSYLNKINAYYKRVVSSREIELAGAANQEHYMTVNSSYVYYKKIQELCENIIDDKDFKIDLDNLPAYTDEWAELMEEGILGLTNSDQFSQWTQSQNY
ncbi:hypothetical protein HOG98_00960 [bacterium]|jgi:hypothetical protein|nr:hypothetical protein [bacterium]